MSGTPELVKRNEMFRWGYREGVSHGIVVTLAAVIAVATVVTVALTLGG